MDGREVVVVAVKPKDVPALLDQIADTLAPPQLLISLAAGVPICGLREALPRTGGGPLHAQHPGGG